MPSMRNQLVKRYLRFLKGMVIRHNKQLDIPFLRQKMHWITTRFPMPKSIIQQHFRIQDIPALHLMPKTNITSTNILLYLHGGGYAIGSMHSHKAMVAQIALTAKVQALLIDYRLAPEHPFPAALVDALTAYQWLIQQGNFKPSQIIIAGDSAGGGLTLATLLALKQYQQPLPAAAICLSPWTDLAATGPSVYTKQGIDPMLDSRYLLSWAKNYVQKNAALTHPFVSPLYGDLAGLPPIFIQASRDEILWSDAQRFYWAAKQAGTPIELAAWEDMVHVWPLFWHLLPESRTAISEIAEFIRRTLR